MKRPAALFASVLTALLCLVACGSGERGGAPGAAPVPAPVGAAQLSGVTLRAGDQKGISLRLLLEASGQLDGLPYRVEWSTFTSGPPMLEAINASAVDAGQVGNTPPIFSAAANGRLSIVGGLRSSVGDALLVPRGSPINRLADLRGRTIAVAKGSSAHGTLLNALAKAGLKPSDVQLAYLQPIDAYAAFNQGSVAAWQVWEPYVAEAVTNGGARELLSGADARDGTGLAAGTQLSNAFSFVVANRAALADPGRNSALRDFVVRVGRAALWARSHSEQWTNLYSRQTGVAPEVARVAAPRLALEPIVLDDAAVAREQQLADRLTEAGQLPRKVDIGTYVDRRFNDAVAPLNSR